MAAAGFIVTGKVQGVRFRAATRDEALRLGLAGHARNLADGGVEVLAVGDGEAIAALQRWLHRGPPLARVAGVARFDADADAAGAGFVTG
ncbi:acylphosphatase [Thermomonas brevis]